MVRDGIENSESGMSSNPTTETSLGTRKPLRYSMELNPYATSSQEQKTADGRSVSEIHSRAAETPDSILYSVL